MTALFVTLKDRLDGNIQTAINNMGFPQFLQKIGADKNNGFLKGVLGYSDSPTALDDDLAIFSEFFGIAKRNKAEQYVSYIQYAHFLWGQQFEQFCEKQVQTTLQKPTFIQKLNEQAGQALQTLGKDDFIDCLENNNSHLFAEFLDYSNHDIFGFNDDIFAIDGLDLSDYQTFIRDRIQDKFFEICQDLLSDGC